MTELHDSASSAGSSWCWLCSASFSPLGVLLDSGNPLASMTAVPHALATDETQTQPWLLYGTFWTGTCAN